MPDSLLKLLNGTFFFLLRRLNGTYRKTVFLHFMVQEIIKSEGTGTDSTNENVQDKVHKKKRKKDNFKKQRLQVVIGLSIDLSHVKKAIGMDSGVLSSYVSKLEMLLDKYWSGRWLPFCLLLGPYLYKALSTIFYLVRERGRGRKEIRA